MQWERWYIQIQKQFREPQTIWCGFCYFLSYLTRSSSWEKGWLYKASSKGKRKHQTPGGKLAWQRCSRLPSKLLWGYGCDKYLSWEGLSSLAYLRVEQKRCLSEAVNWWAPARWGSTGTARGWRGDVVGTSVLYAVLSPSKGCGTAPTCANLCRLQNLLWVKQNLKMLLTTCIIGIL